jgi:2',3'-cyclic-nucleotide 2'-phosphodiesterase (5'-nucleotidase family)
MFRRRSRKRLAVLVGLVFGTAAAVLALGAGSAKPDFVILFTHDLHSNVLPRTVVATNGARSESGGFGRLATLIRAERERAAGLALVLDGGDFSMGTLFHTLFASESAELRLLGLMGYDATTLGNHEFDFRLDGLGQSLAAAKAKGKVLPVLVASNIAIEGRDAAAEAGRAAFGDYPLRDFAVFERQGKKVGVFGIFGRDAADDSPFAAPATFLDPVAEAHRVVELLRGQEKADLIICLSHSGTSPDRKRSADARLAEDVPGIDVIISGHTHTILTEPLAVGRTIVISCGANGDFLGRLELSGTAETGYKAVSYKLLPVGPEVPEDPVVSEAAAGFKSLVEQRFLSSYRSGFEEILAESVFDMETIEAMEKSAAESGLGDMVADAFREAVRRAEGPAYRHVHVVVEPVGVIRDTILEGPITIDRVFRLLSLGLGDDGEPGYPLLGITLTGRELRRLVEVQASIAPMKSDAALQFSGVKFSYNPRRFPFDRVTRASVLEPDGSFRPLEPRKLYRVVLNSYSAGMVDYVSRASHGLLKMQARNAEGKVLARAMEAAVDADPIRPGIQELKEWKALADVLSAFPDTNGNGIPDIPERYRRPDGRFSARPSWNPVGLLLGGNGLTYFVLAIFLAVMAVVFLVIRRIVRRGKARRSLSRSSA